MTDEALRGLARDWQTRPGDVTAGLAYARALERAGGARRERYLALCALARVGSTEARSMVARWIGPDAVLGAPPMPNLDQARSRVIRVEGLRFGRALGVWNGHAFVGTGSAFMAIDLRSGVTTWSVPCIGWAFMRGDEVVILDDVSLSLRDLKGRRLVEARLPWTPDNALANGDRLIVSRQDRGRVQLAAIDTGVEFGRSLWSAEGLEDGSLYLAGPSLVRITSSHRLEAVDLGTGAITTLCQLMAGQTNEARRVVGVVADTQGETLLYTHGPTPQLVYDFSEPDVAPTSCLGEVDLRTGRHSWRLTQNCAAGGLWIGPNFVFTAADDELIAIDRATTSVRWRAPLGGSRYVLSVEPVQDQLVCLSGQLVGGGGFRMTLRCFDLESGRTTAHVDMALPAGSLRMPLGLRAPPFASYAHVLDDAGFRFLWPWFDELVLVEAPVGSRTQT